MRVLVVGGASWDTTVHIDALPEPRAQTIVASRTCEAVGSTGAGKALNLAALGHDVYLHALLGSDDPGERVATYLRDAGVTLLTDTLDCPTEQHINLMTPAGERLSIFKSPPPSGADLDYSWLLVLAEDCDAVVVNISDYARALIPRLDEIGIPFWTDLHDWDGIDPYHWDFAAGATCVIVSHDRLDDPEGLCAHLAADGRLVVCTRGAAGASAWLGGERHDVAAVSVDEFRDSNGAGDAFTAGLMHAMANGWSLERSLRAAAVAGASAVGSDTLSSPALTAELLDKMTG